MNGKLSLYKNLPPERLMNSFFYFFHTQSRVTEFQIHIQQQEKQQHAISLLMTNRGQAFNCYPNAEATNQTPSHSKNIARESNPVIASLLCGKRKSNFFAVKFLFSPKKLFPQIPTTPFLAGHNGQQLIHGVIVLVFGSI